METAASGHGSTSEDCAVFLIGGARKDGGGGARLCYYFGLCFTVQVSLALNQAGTLTLFVSTCSNWPLSGKLHGALYEATLGNTVESLMV